MNPQPIIDQCKIQLEPIDAVTEYEATVRKKYSFREVGGPFVDMNPATVLREVDPIQYQIGLNKHCARHDLVKVGDCYYDRQDAIMVVETVTDGIGYTINQLRNQQNRYPDQHDRLAIRITNLEVDAQEMREYIK